MNTLHALQARARTYAQRVKAVLLTRAAMSRPTAWPEDMNGGAEGAGAAAVAAPADQQEHEQHLDHESVRDDGRLPPPSLRRLEHAPAALHATLAQPEALPGPHGAQICHAAARFGHALQGGWEPSHGWARNNHDNDGAAAGACAGGACAGAGLDHPPPPAREVILHHSPHRSGNFDYFDDGDDDQRRALAQADANGDPDDSRDGDHDNDDDNDDDDDDDDNDGDRCWALAQAETFGNPDGRFGAHRAGVARGSNDQRAELGAAMHLPAVTGHNGNAGGANRVCCAPPPHASVSIERALTRVQPCLAVVTFGCRTYAPPSSRVIQVACLPAH
jgi:hypothetical protein